MASTFETKLKKVQSMQQSLEALQTQVEHLRYELKQEQKELQEMCVHDFFAESDGDYHRPGYYYICKHCNFLTRVLLARKTLE